MDKYIFTEIEPECTDNSCEWEDICNIYIDNNDLAVFGNRRLDEYKNNIIGQVIDAIYNGELYGELDYHTNLDVADIVDYIEIYTNIIISGKYSDDKVMEMYAIIMNNELSDIQTVCELLFILTGKHYDYTTITGCVQGDYQEIIYNTDISDNEIMRIEAVYFNMGNEWILDDCIRYYTIGWNDNDIKIELADMLGVSTNDIVLRRFAGYSKTPIYKEV